MKKSTCLLLFSLITLNLSAQDVHRKVRRLASKICFGIPTDSLKVRAIYEWVTDNIVYDVKLYKSRNYISDEFHEAQQAKKVIKRKKAVCAGYSNLFQDLCLASGIRAYSISGYCKTLNPRTYKLALSSETHAWNVVKINNIWYLCDPTWSAGYIDSKRDYFIKSRNDDFYLKNGEAFIKDHLPSDPAWQLLENPFYMDEFCGIIKPQTKEKFNYLDTLRVFEHLSTEDQALNSYLRGLRFDNCNDIAKTHLVYYYADKISNDVKVWNDLIMSFIDNKTDATYKKAAEEKEKVYNLLANIEKDLNQVTYYFSAIPSNSKIRRVSIQNMKSVNANRRFTRSVKARLNRYYNALEKMKS